MTNFERIKNMSKEEMAEAMTKRFACYACPSKDCSGHRGECKDYLVDWLNEEAEE